MTLIERYLTKNDCYKANVAKADSRYVVFQERGPQGLMLHSVGCAQPSAEVLINRWDAQSIDKCVHGFIDANTGTVYQTLPWNFRGWHGGGSCNNTHLGVEMCESGYIKYTKGIQFEVLDRTRAVQDCTRAYHSAVELFAYLAAMLNLNPMTAICSHKEGYQMGIASGHQDPEHYWKGLNMPYSMDMFRADVKAKMEEQRDMTKAETIELIKEMFPAQFDEAYAAKMASLLDNDAGAWSKDAREWAIANDEIAGVGKLPSGDTNYAWKSYLTREQYIQFRYNDAKKGDG